MSDSTNSKDLNSLPEYNKESPDYLVSQVVYKAMCNLQADIPEDTPLETRIKVMTILSDMAQSCLNASSNHFSQCPSEAVKKMFS